MNFDQNVELICDPPYRPDLAPSDIILYINIKWRDQAFWYIEEQLFCTKCSAKTNEFFLKYEIYEQKFRHLNISKFVGWHIGGATNKVAGNRWHLKNISLISHLTMRNLSKWVPQVFTSVCNNWPNLEYQLVGHVMASVFCDARGVILFLDNQ